MNNSFVKDVSIALVVPSERGWRERVWSILQSVGFHQIVLLMHNFDCQSAPMRNFVCYCHPRAMLVHVSGDKPGHIESQEV